MLRTLSVVLGVSSALLAVPAASAKDFRPGDLRMCDRARCVGVVSRAVLRELGPFYYGAGSPGRIARPRLGAPYYELRFRNGYVTGIVAPRRLDRFLSYGVNLGRFVRDRWYVVPPRIAGELRRLSAGLRPYRLTRTALSRSH